VAYSVEVRYPRDYVRKDGSLFCLLKLRCGHEHLTIKSAAACKERLAKSSRAIGYAIGRFGKVAEIATHRVVTDEEIRRARATELNEAEAFRIVLNLAKRGHQSYQGDDQGTCKGSRSVQPSRTVCCQAAMSR
jgi:hypothetical protein